MPICPLVLPNEIELEAIDSWSAVKLDEGRYLAFLASIIPSHLSIVEIGSFQGRSTCFLAAGSKYGHKAPVYAVDPWKLCIDGITGEQLYAAFLANLDKVGVSDIVHPLRGESSEIVRKWEQPVGLLYIDDGHDYEAVLEQYGDWSPFVVENGWIAFHDCYYPDVARVIDECIRRSDRWRIEDIPRTSVGLLIAQRVNAV